MLTFTKPFTQQEPIPEAGIQQALEILRHGRLHRYNVMGAEISEVSLLEQEYAKWQGARYCVATASGGQAIQLGLRVCGVGPGDRVLANAYTLAPVPGAIHAVGAEPVLVEIDADYHIDYRIWRKWQSGAGQKPCCCRICAAILPIWRH